MQIKVRVIIFVQAVVFKPAALLHLNLKVFLVICEVAQFVDYFDNPIKISSITF